MSYLKGALGMIGGGMGAMALLNEGKGETFTSYPNENRLKQLLGKTSDENVNPLELKKRNIEKVYDLEFKEGNENKFTYMPEMKIEDERLVVKLDDDALRHASYINSYAGQMSVFGTDNRDIVYEIDGKKHAYDFGLRGARLIPLENMENNPFTKDLPSGNQMMPEDFR